METLAIELSQVLEALEGMLLPLAGSMNSESVRLVARPEVALGFAIIWLLLRRKGRKPAMAGDSDQILRHRFERGEITKETYERIMNRTHEAGR